jgi:DUF4097 and DUF4098 domain-containing protein YvlB
MSNYRRNSLITLLIIIIGGFTFSNFSEKTIRNLCNSGCHTNIRSENIFEDIFVDDSTLEDPDYPSIGYAFGLQTFEVGQLTMIDVDTSEDRIRIEPTEESVIEVSYASTNYWDYIIKSTETSIHIEKIWLQHDYVPTTVKRSEITIRIPKDSKFRYTISTSNDAIDVRDLSILDSWFETSNAFVGLNNLKLGENQLEVISSNANLSLENIDTQALITLQTSNGRVDAKDIKASDLIVSTNNGVINLNDAEISRNINLSTSNDAVNLGIVTAENLYITNQNGSIGFEQIDIDEIVEMVTENASVYGLVLGSIDEYDLTLSTSNADVRLNDDLVSEDYYEVKTLNKKRSLHISTTNCNILIESESK